MDRVFVCCLVLVSLFFFSSRGHTDTLPECEFAASDYDGDGWGWENNHSCQVSAQSTGKPVFVNLQSGTEVALIRPYWNAYRDFDDRTVQCDLYVYDHCDYFGQPGLCNNTADLVQGQNYYQLNQQIYDPKRGTPQIAMSQRIYHYALPADAPWAAIQRTTFNSKTRPTDADWFAQEYVSETWTVNDGIYYADNGWLSEARYVELVDERNGSVKHWVADSAYYHCYDTAGETFQPTGFPLEPRPDPIEAIPGAYVFDVNSDNGAPTVTNRESDSSVEFERIYWKMEKLFNKEVSCSSYTWSDTGQQYSADFQLQDPETMSARFLFYPPPYDSPLTSFYKREPGDLHFTYTARWTIQDGVLTEGPYFMQATHAEILTVGTGSGPNEQSPDRNALRLWQDSSRYFLCDMESNILDVVSTDLPADNAGGASGEESAATDGFNSTPGNNGGTTSVESSDSGTGQGNGGGGAIAFFPLQIILLTHVFTFFGRIRIYSFRRL